MTTKSFSCATVFLVLLAIACPAIAQESTEKSPVLGSWKFQRDSLAGTVKCELRFVEKDGKLHGTYTDEEKVEAKVGDVTVKDNEVSIQLLFNIDGKKSEAALSGKLDGDKIVGKMVDGDGEQDWKATRFVALQDVVGQWRLSFTTPDGVERNPEFEVKVKDGEPVVEFDEGSTEEASGGEVSKLKFKQGLMLFNLKLDFQGAALNLEYELEFMDANNLEGSMYFEFEGMDQSGEVDLEGTRIK